MATILLRVPILAALAAALVTAQSPPDAARLYSDPQGRFQFAYPSAFGSPSTGTDSGFQNRTAAIRFSEFSAGVHGGRIILGGEAVLTSGPPQLDLQAAGGLYDPITLQVFPEPIAKMIRNALPVLTPSGVCDALGSELHLDASDGRFRAMTAQQKAAIPAVDRMGNFAPRILRCAVLDTTVTFDKESALMMDGPRRHIYGAIRFLPPPYSSFQLIRGSADAPAAADITRMTALVNSWKEK